MDRTGQTAAAAVALLLSAGLATGTARAQSDPSQFGTIFNIGTVPTGSIFDVPGAVAGTVVGDGDFSFGNGGLLGPGNLMGDVLGSNSQLNLFDGGEIRRSFSAGPPDGTGSNIEVNIFGGTVGDFFNAFSGSTVNISGGVFGSDFRAISGSTVNISGGEFLLNGSAVSGVGFGGVFTGVLEDGSVFIFASEAGDEFALGTTTLQSAPVAPSSNPGVLFSGAFTKGVRAGETLTVTGDGVLGDNFAVVGGTLDIEGGSVGEGLEVAFGEVNISGGSVGVSPIVFSQSMSSFAGSTVNISGGSVGSFFEANSGSTVNISGGSVGEFFDANFGSAVNISGGTVGRRFGADFGSTVNISGGSVGEEFFADSRSTVTISGGTVGEEFDAFDGSTVTISGGTVGDLFFANTNSAITISGGSVGERFEAFESTVHVSGGIVGSGFEGNRSEVHISGGIVGEGFEAFRSTVNISGGIVGKRFETFLGMVNVSGGSVGSGFEATAGVINISGGTIGDSFSALNGSTVNLFVSDISIDGTDLGLTLGETIEIEQRGGALLEATLADGSFFDLQLNSSFVSGQDFVSSDATLTVTLVPTPGAAVALGLGGLFAARRRRG